MTDSDSDPDRNADTGPDRIRSIAVHREDVAAALEATLRTDRRVVLRITPPFSGRMRARIHDATGEDALDGDVPDENASGRQEEDPSPIHLDPRRMVIEVPPYPEVDETAAAYPDADIETRRERHADAVDDWRRTVRESVVESVVIDAAGEEHVVDVAALG